MKLFFAYVRTHIKILLLFLMFSAIFGLVFMLYDLPAEAVAYAGLLCLAACLPFFIVGYVRFRNKHKTLRRMMNQIKVSIDGLPQPANLREQDYQDLLRELFEGKQKAESEFNAKYGDMLEYYTLWVHQIKTPIAAMNLLLQSKETEENLELREQLFKIEQYAGMVLEYLRTETMTSDLVLREYPLDSIVKQAVKKYAKLFIRKKISLEYSELNRNVLTDEKWLVFVIEQLLSNALKYTNQGKVTIKMDDSDQDTLVISDTGIGITEEDLPRIGERGYTGYNGRMDKKSTGIGLFLCKRILTTLSHSIEINSVVSKGTIIKINFNKEDIMAD